MTAWAIAHQMAKAKELSYSVAGGIFNGADRCSESLHLGASPGRADRRRDRQAGRAGEDHHTPGHADRRAAASRNALGNGRLGTLP